MKKLFLTIVLILTVFLGYAQIDPQVPLDLDKRVLTGKLDNGLTYFVMHNEKPAQRADFYIVTNVGAVQETPDQDGLAHFLEHMAFNGTKHFPGKGIISYMESLGCAFGYNVNAATGWENTQYTLMNVPVIREGIIDSSLLILYDWSAHITNDATEIDKERGVILEEWRQGHNVDERAWLEMQKAIFRGSAMEEVSIIGKEDQMKTFRHESLIDFYKTWYRPDLQSVVVVGDIDAEAVVAKIKDLFGQLPKAESPMPKEPVVVPENVTPIVSFFKDAELNSTDVTFVVKNESIPFQFRGLGIAMISKVMESLCSSIINERFQDISRSKNAPFLQSGIYFADLSNSLSVVMSGVSSKEGEAVPAFRAMMIELERVKRYGFTPDEFERAKTNFMRECEVNRNNADSRENGDLAKDIAYYFTSGYPYMEPEYEYNVVQNCISMITLDMLNMAVKELYDEKNIVMSYSAPEKKRLKMPSEQELLNVLAAVKQLEISAPEIVSLNEPLMDSSTLQGSKVISETAGLFGTTVWSLENGIQVIVKPTDYKKDEVWVTTVAFGGYSILSEELIPSFESNIFDVYNSTAGLGAFNQSQIEKMLTGKAVEFVPYVYNRQHGVMVYSSPEDLETAFQLAYLSYVKPRFNKEDFEAGLDKVKAVLPDMYKDPDNVFAKVTYETSLCNSPRRPYISEELVEKVSLANIEKGYKQLFSDQGGLKVFITGNVKLGEIKPMIEKYIGSLPVLTEKGTSWVDEGIPSPEGEQKKVFAVPMKTPKVLVDIYYNGPMEKCLENDVRMSLLNNILEQLYTKTIREEEGGTYGVSVYGGTYGEPHEFYSLDIIFSTDVSKSAKLIELVKQGLVEIAANGPDGDYVKKAKKKLTKDFSEVQIDNNYWCDIVQEYYLYGRDNHTAYLETIEKVANPESIQKFVQEILSSGNILEMIMNPEK